MATTDVTDVDAIVEMAQRSLDTVESPARRDRFRTNIHLTPSGAATDARGWSTPRRHPQIHHLRRAADTGVHRRVDPHLGRSHPTHDPATHPPDRAPTRPELPRAGCNETHHLEVHHIIHWEDGGPTDTWNLIAVCPRHHRMHHRGELGIHGNADLADGISFTNRHGRPIGSTGARPHAPRGPTANPRPGCTNTLSANASTSSGSTSTRHPNTAPPPGPTTPTTPSEPADAVERRITARAQRRCSTQ